VSQILYTTRDDLPFAPGARGYQIACEHGASSAVMLPGRKPLDDQVIFDVLLVGHRRARQCACPVTLGWRRIARPEVSVPTLRAAG